MAGLFSKQGLLGGVGFRFGFLEIQVRLVIGMLGGLSAVKETVDREQRSPCVDR